MKKLLLLTLCLGWFSLVFSQKKTPDQKATEIVAEMSEVCGDLTEQQKTELHVVLVKKIEKKRAIKADSSLTDEQKKEKKKVLKKETKPLIKAIMTEAQWEKWKAHRKIKKGEKKGKGHEHKDHK